MSIFVRAAYDLLKPNNDPQLIAPRFLSMGLGLIGLVSAIAGKVFGTMSATSAYFLGGISATAIIGSAIGSFGLIALAAITGLGIGMAIAPAPIPVAVVLV